MFEGTDRHREVSGGEIEPERRSNLPDRGLCEGRENGGSVPIGEAPDSVRGLSGVQYPSRVNEKVFGGWWNAWPGSK